jgi:small subunit ribosomal protein S3
LKRAANRLKIIIYTARPGIIIGRKGAEIEKLKEDLSRKTGREVIISIQEIRQPELNAQLQAEKIAQQLEKRIAFRRAMKKTMEESQRFGRRRHQGNDGWTFERSGNRPNRVVARRSPAAAHAARRY